MNAAPDRYVSFEGIDCAGNSRALIAAIRRHIDRPERSNPLWERFKARLAAAGDSQASTGDELYLVCSHVYYIEELFDAYDDAEGLELLRKLEYECC
ncbi:N(2)-fixation sustaining protein CowN [Roseospirillum parvum]|uniref:N(2)-fixation sustaining protein CowN n=1 Tax=Roseospirillum parvum TaxID=83401 RepID=A0A1G8APE2_9PROT|nr:N(2)-fixation sustaining protein CowN [Roseospirillum parvum]SDH22759.1 hypothetical protein SAMN05421742_10561 [Roseospirillum parvum]